MSVGIVLMSPRLLAGALLLALCSLQAHAAFTVVMPPPGPANVGSAGNSFEVLLFNDSNTPIGPFSLDSYNVALTVPIVSGIVFTNVTPLTNKPYVFAGNSLGILSSVSAGGTR